MTQTVAYVRVSTEDQTEHSPDAQAKRCRDLAKLKGLGPVRVLTDEGWSGKNLDRPQMAELLKMVRAGEVSHLIVWRWDRMSRDTGDFSTLVKLFSEFGVSVHSVNEGDLDVASAAGRMQIGVHGVFAQFYRDQTTENSKMGALEAFSKGYHQNRPPTGYDLINKELVPNEMAPIVKIIFKLRAEGASVQAIADATDMGYSTVYQILRNRTYLGEVKYSGKYGPGRHEPLITLEEFNASTRGHTPGRRRSRDLCAGKIRCGNCGQVASIHYNDRNQASYRCRTRGKSCPGQSARSAQGLIRAALLGLRELAHDTQLQEAIRAGFQAASVPDVARSLTVQSTLTALATKKRKLLDLYFADRIDGSTFSDEERRLSAQMTLLEAELEEQHEKKAKEQAKQASFNALVEQFAAIDFDKIWDEATPSERRVLIEDFLENIYLYPDRLTVQVVGAPAIMVTLQEVGLHHVCRTIVSKGGLEPPRPYGH